MDPCEPVHRPASPKGAFAIRVILLLMLAAGASFWALHSAG